MHVCGHVFIIRVVVVIPSLCLFFLDLCMSTVSLGLLAYDICSFSLVRVACFNYPCVMHNRVGPTCICIIDFQLVFVIVFLGVLNDASADQC